MRSIKEMLASSSAGLKDLRILTLASFLAAIYAVSYSPFAGNFIIIPGIIEIRFGFIVIAIAAALFGPTVAVSVAFVGDIIGTLIFYGGQFFWGFTLSWMIQGFVFGLFFYKEKISVRRIVFAMLFNTGVINMILTTKWEQMMGFGTFEALFAKRFIVSLVMCPVNIILLVFVLRAACSAYRKIKLIM